MAEKRPLTSQQVIKKIAKMESSYREKSGALREQLVDAYVRESLKCFSCYGLINIAESSLVSVDTFVPPFGCTGGSYWEFSRFEIQCNHCSWKNKYYKKEEVFSRIVAMKPRFKNIVNIDER